MCAGDGPDDSPTLQHQGRRQQASLPDTTQLDGHCPTTTGRLAVDCCVPRTPERVTCPQMPPLPCSLPLSPAVGQDLYGADITSAPGQSAGDCCTICRETPDCGAFTFNTLNIKEGSQKYPGYKGTCW